MSTKKAVFTRSSVGVPIACPRDVMFAATIATRVRAAPVDSIRATVQRYVPVRIRLGRLQRREETRQGDLRSVRPPYPCRLRWPRPDLRPQLARLRLQPGRGSRRARRPEPGAPRSAAD